MTSENSIYGYCLVVIENYVLKLKCMSLKSIGSVSHINWLSFRFQLEIIDSKIKSLKLYNPQLHNFFPAQ